MKKLIFAFLLLTVCVITNGQKKKVDVYLHDPGWYLNYPLAKFKTDPRVQADYTRLAEQYKAAKQQQRINELKAELEKAKMKSHRVGEVSLYDKTGHAKVYAEVREEFSGIDITFYLWNGSPVAYIPNKRDRASIYNFRGKHLGWANKGFFYDNDGYIICAMEDKLNIVTQAEKAKFAKIARPNKNVKEPAPARPVFKHEWSSISLEDFFQY